MDNILTLVRKELPYLNDAYNTDIEAEKVNQFYKYFVAQLGKAETLISDEANFSVNEKFFLSYMISHTLLNRRVVQNVEGSSGESTQKIKKAKADVVEVEYSEEKKSFTLDTATILSRLEKEVCHYASILGISVHFCQSNNSGNNNISDECGEDNTELIAWRPI